MSDLIFSIVTVSTALAVGLMIYLVLAFFINRWNKFAVSKKVKIKLSYIKGPLSSLVPAVCVLFSLPVLRLQEEMLPIVSQAVYLWLIASLGWLSIKAIHMFRDLILSNYDVQARDNLQARRVYTQIGVISNILTAGVILLTAALMLMVFGAIRQIGVSILASAGIVGIILGFAAQKALGNLIAGIQIAVAQPIRIDDAVVVENEWGWIEEITLTYVVVRIWDLRRLILPISYFIEKPFQNWTRTQADILGSVFIYADYTVPVKGLRAEFERILRESPYWDKKVKVVQVTNATEQTVELRFLMSAADSPTAWNLRCEVREKLLGFLQERFPQSLPKTRVELRRQTS